MGKQKNSKKHQQKIKRDLDFIDKLVKEIDEKEQKKKLKQTPETTLSTPEVKQQPSSPTVEPSKPKKKKQKHQEAKQHEKSNKTEKQEKKENEQVKSELKPEPVPAVVAEEPKPKVEETNVAPVAKEVTPAPVETTATSSSPVAENNSEAPNQSGSPVFKQKLGYMTISMRFLSALKREVFKRYQEDSLKRGVKLEPAEDGEGEGDEPRQEEVQLDAVVEEKGGSVIAEARAPELEAKYVSVPSISLPPMEGRQEAVPLAPREAEELAQKRREAALPKNKTREQLFEELDPEKNTIKGLTDIGYSIPYVVQYGPNGLALTLVVEKKEVSPGKVKKTYTVKLAPLEQTSDEKLQKLQQWTFREDGTIRSVYRKTRVLEIEAGQVGIAKQSLKSKEVPASRQWKVVFSDEKGRPTKCKLICVQKNARLVMAESAKDPSKIAVNAMKTVLGYFDLGQKWIFSTRDSATQ